MVQTSYMDCVCIEQAYTHTRVGKLNWRLYSTSVLACVTLYGTVVGLPKSLPLKFLIYNHARLAAGVSERRNHWANPSPFSQLALYLLICVRVISNLYLSECRSCALQSLLIVGVHWSCVPSAFTDFEVDFRALKFQNLWLYPAHRF